MAEQTRSQMINNQWANITYTSGPAAELAWSLHDNSTQSRTISSDCIVGLVETVNARFVNTYDLAYVEIDPRSEGRHEEERTMLCRVFITDPPQDLLDDFLVPTQAHWHIVHGLHPANGKESESYIRVMPRGLNAVINHDTYLHIILSVASGHRNAQSVNTKLLQVFLGWIGHYHSKPSTYQLYTTTSSTSITDLARTTILPTANAGIRQEVILLSGDGGVADLINGLLSSSPRSSSYAKPTLVLLPLGTGNALAHSTGLAEDKTIGMSALFRGIPAPLPVYTVHFSPNALPLTPAPSISNQPAPVLRTHGAIILSWALHASLVSDSDTPSARQQGAERFQQAAETNLAPPHAYQGRISYRPRGDHKWKSLQSSRHAYVVATLCARLEKTFTVSPDSKPLDGVLRLVYVSAYGSNNSQDGNEQGITSEKLTEIIMSGYQEGAHVQRTEVLYEPIDALRITMEEEDVPENEQESEKGGRGRWRRVCVDGKIYVLERGASVEIWPPGVEPDRDIDNGESGERRTSTNGMDVCDIVYLPKEPSGPV